MAAAECDRNFFLKLIKRERSPTKICLNATRNEAGNVLYDNEDVIVEWTSHFSNLCQAKVSSEFDNVHYDSVTQRVKKLAKEDDIDDFLVKPFTRRVNIIKNST